MAKILVVEDDGEINALIAIALRSDQHEVVQARNPEEARCRMAEELPELILTDVMMPVSNGYDFARSLQEDAATKAIPLIFVTARQNLEDRLQGLEYAVDYIAKPFAVPELLARVRAVLRVRKLQQELETTNELLARLVVTDELTGLCNRRGFDTQLEDELWRARRFHEPMTFILFDLDHFKDVNDTRGHARGDQVLREFARVLRESSRHVDRVGRYGGEEFTVALPSTDLSGACFFAEKVRSQTMHRAIPVRGESPISFTVSGGGVVIHPCQQGSVSALAARLIEVADRHLYEAKNAGRNRVIIAEMD